MRVLDTLRHTLGVTFPYLADLTSDNPFPPEMRDKTFFTVT